MLITRNADGCVPTVGWTLKDTGVPMCPRIIWEVGRGSHVRREWWHLTDAGVTKEQTAGRLDLPWPVFPYLRDNSCKESQSTVRSHLPFSFLLHEQGKWKKQQKQSFLLSKGADTRAFCSKKNPSSHPSNPAPFTQGDTATFCGIFKALLVNPFSFLRKRHILFSCHKLKVFLL